MNDNRVVRNVERVKKKYVHNNEDEECLVCLDTLPYEHTKLPCGHTCCPDCFMNYLENEVKNAKVSKIKCFVANCTYVLNEGFILSMLIEDQELSNKYKDFKKRAEIMNNSNKKFCPKPDCNSFLLKSKDKYVQCENGHKYCYICLKSWHGESKCDEELDKDFQIWSKHKVIKKCPRCKIYTEKNEGCNHMTCAECKYQWCWLCEGEYKDGHFRRGTCNGLQFAKIEHLEEKEYLPSEENKMTRDQLRKRQKEKGFFLFNKEIKNKIEYFGTRNLFRLYYGNKCMEFLFCLFITVGFFQKKI